MYITMPIYIFVSRDEILKSRRELDIERVTALKKTQLTGKRYVLARTFIPVKEVTIVLAPSNILENTKMLFVTQSKIHEMWAVVP